MDRDKISDALETLAQALDSSTRNKQPTMRTKRTDSRALLRKDKSRRNSLDVGETEDGDPTSLFFESDKDKSGGIELNEFVDVVKVLNPSQKEDDVKRKFESADLRKTGSLSLPEFVRVIDPVAWYEFNHPSYNQNYIDLYDIFFDVQCCKYYFFSATAKTPREGRVWGLRKKTPPPSLS